jgi:hypothetical protein
MIVRWESAAQRATDIRLDGLALLRYVTVTTETKGTPSQKQKTGTHHMVLNNSKQDSGTMIDDWKREKNGGM